MTLNVQDVIFASSFSGLGNRESLEFSVDVPSQSMSAGAAVVYVASVALTESDSIAEVYVRYTNIDSDWYWLDGFQSFTDPVASEYTISTRTYIQSGTLYVSNFIVHSAGGTLPAITIDCKGAIYDAPFVG